MLTSVMSNKQSRSHFKHFQVNTHVQTACKLLYLNMGLVSFDIDYVHIYTHKNKSLLKFIAGQQLIKGVKKVRSALHHRISNHLKRKRC